MNVGDVAIVSLEFRVYGALTDAQNVRVRVEPPRSAPFEMIGSAAGLGKYEVCIDCTEPGTWGVHAVMNTVAVVRGRHGRAKAAERGSFEVYP